MKPNAKLTRMKAGRTQTGATLLVAIMMLLVITLLALSSMRGVSLESRITGNLKMQKSLTAAAEGGLRMGERSIGFWSCTGTGSGTGTINDPPAPCVSVLGLTPNANGDYPTRFVAANLATINSITSGYGDMKIQWYVVDLRSVNGPAQNTCGVKTAGCGRRYYEITSCASTVLCTSDATTQRVILRTVFSVAAPSN